jgi:hypothetical protein
LGYNAFSQNGWVQLLDYPGSGRVGNAGFTFYSEGLAGMGNSGGSTAGFTDFWAYQPSSSSWVQKLNFAGNARYGQNGFTIGKFGYICLGTNAVSYLNDLWMFDEAANSWTQKANFPGIGRYGAVSFGGTGKAYVGLGEHDTGGGLSDYPSDFYEYEQSTNTWTPKASFPGQPRYFAFSFFINGKFYVVGGRTEDLSQNWVYLKDMWAYDPALNTWTQKTSYPGNGEFSTAGFVIGSYAYVGLGYNNGNSANCADFWRYDPVNDTWFSLANFPGGARRGSMSFSINNTGYVGCGYSTVNKSDFWKFNDIVGLGENKLESAINLYPVPSDNKVYIEGANINKVIIYTANGSFVKEINIPKLIIKSQLDISELAPGFYYADIYAGKDIIF